MSVTKRKTLSHPYIIQEKGICNNSPIIAGTRIRVIDIAIEYDRLGYSPDQIADAHPHLNLPQIHDALSYYYEYQQAIDMEIAARKKEIFRLKEKFPSKMKAAHGRD